MPISSSTAASRHDTAETQHDRVIDHRLRRLGIPIGESGTKHLARKVLPVRHVALLRSNCSCSLGCVDRWWIVFLGRLPLRNRTLILRHP